MDHEKDEKSVDSIEAKTIIWKRSGLPWDYYYSVELILMNGSDRS
jgi:hypothetical protein